MRTINCKESERREQSCNFFPQDFRQKYKKKGKDTKHCPKGKMHNYRETFFFSETNYRETFMPQLVAVKVHIKSPAKMN